MNDALVNKFPADASDLRRRAEIKLNSGEVAPHKVLSLDEANHLLHELKVHQIEIEIQNEELRRVQVELEASRAKYFDLYDMAPVGYFTISEEGLILEANLAAATMLGVSRNAFVDKFLSSVVSREDQDIFYTHRKQLLETGTLQPFEIRLVKKSCPAVWVSMEATMSHDADGALVSRVVMSDISGRKKADELLKEKADKLELARSKIKVLSSLLPICFHCKKIRDEQGYWNKLEAYISEHSNTEFSHGICDDCLNKFYPKEAAMIWKGKEEKRSSDSG